MFLARPRNKGFRGSSSLARPASIAGQLYKQAMDNAFKADSGRMPEYRPSSFPLCSVRVFMKLVEGAHLGYFEEERTAFGDFFTKVGTTAHENIQFHMGFSGKIFGDWKCRHLGCQHGRDALDLYNDKGECIRPGKLTRKNTTKHRCPLCKRPMEYVEKEISYKGLKGHIDCIIQLDDGSYWVSDYKTTTKNKIEGKKLPEKKHLKQLPGYCWVLEKKYKMRIAGFSLLYFTRDNPGNFYEYAEKWTSKWRQTCAAMIQNEREVYKAGVRSFVTLDTSHAIAHKPCKTRAFYEKHIHAYTECPMLDVCFREGKLESALKKHIKQFPTKPKTRDKIAESIGILKE